MIFGRPLYIIICSHVFEDYSSILVAFFPEKKKNENKSNVSRNNFFSGKTKTNSKKLEIPSAGTWAKVIGLRRPCLFLLFNFC